MTSLQQVISKTIIERAKEEVWTASSLASDIIDWLSDFPNDEEVRAAFHATGEGGDADTMKIALEAGLKRRLGIE